MEREYKGDRREEGVKKTEGGNRGREVMFGGGGEEEEWQDGKIEPILDIGCSSSLCGLR